MKSILREKNIGILIILFFIFGSIFPTLRILTIGSRTSQNIGEYMFSVLPEIFSIFVLVFSWIIFCKNKIEIKLKYFDLILIGFIVSNVLLGVFLAKDLLLSMYGIRMSYFPILFYFIFRYGKIDLMLKTINKIFIWFIIVGIVGLILYFGFYDQMIFMIKKTSPVVAEYFIVRMTSVFWTPVLFSTFMVTTFIYFYNQFLDSPKWYYYIILGLIWFCVLLSVTRGGLIVLLIGFIFISLIYKKWKLSFQILFLLFIIFIIIGYYISSPLIFLSWILKSVSETVGLKDGVTRVDLWIKAIENFKTCPFGFGLGKAGHIAARFFKNSTQDVAIYSTDGWYLKLANETGLWGLLSYSFLAVSFIIISIKSKLFNNEGLKIICLFVIFLMINIQNLVSNVLDFYLFSFLYWGILGLTLNIIYNTNNKV